MVSKNLHDFLDAMDHAELIRELKSKGLMAIDPLTKEVVAHRLGIGDTSLEASEFLNQVSNLHRTQLAQGSSTELKQAVGELKAAQQKSRQTQNPPKKSRPNIRSSPSNQTKTSVPQSPQPPTQQIDVRIAAEEALFADVRTYLPVAAPILLYLLVGLSFTGVFLSMGTPSSLALSLGLAFAAMIPIFMPSHPIHLPLAGISAVGWFLIFLASLLTLDTADSPELVQMLTTLEAPANLYIHVVFMMFTVGVALFSNPPEFKMWTRRMANNLSGFALLVLLLGLLNPVLANIEFISLMLSTLIGLWGITVLGQTQPINLRSYLDLLAISSLAIALLGFSGMWGYNQFVLLFFSVLCGGLAFLAPNLENQQHSALLLALSATGVVGIGMFIAGDSSPGTIGWGCGMLILALTSVICQMELRFREINKSETVINKILPPAASLQIDNIHEIESDIAVLGFKGAGKTSFFGGLWLALSDNTTRDLWYGSSPALHGTRELGFGVEEIKKLLLDTSQGQDSALLERGSDLDVLETYLQHRFAPATMRKEFETGIMPPTDERFPFDVSINRKTRVFLESFSEKLSDPNPTSRSVADATQLASDSLSLTLRFPARLSETFPVWFGASTKTKEIDAVVHNRIQSMDVPGEDVRSAVDFMEGKRIRSKSINDLLNQIMSREDEFGDYRFAIEYIVKMTAQFKHVIFVIDADEFTKPGGKSQPVGAFLRLANELSQLRGASLKKVTLLLNKSDSLINRAERGNRNMPGGGLSGWEDIMNRDLARQTLEEILSPALLYNLQIPYEVYFTCTLGGVITKATDPDEQPIEVPTFPMVPIHVVEPILRTMMADQEESRP